MRLLLSIFGLFFGFVLLGQCNLTISGLALDQHHEEVLAFASIYAVESGTGVVTDENGAFTILGLCPGKLHLEVSHIGCESKSFFIELKTDTIIELLLEHHQEVLSEVTVTEHNHNHSLSQAVYSISGDKLRQLKGRSLGDIVAALPGVDLIKTGSNVSKPIIQGLSGNRIAVMNDGVILESQQWGIDHAPEINGDGAEKVSVIKSSAPILYGTQAMGGVIIVESAKTLSDPHLHGDVNAIFQTNGRVAGWNTRLQKKIAKFDLKGNLNYKKGGDQSTSSYYLNNTGTREYGGNIKMGSYTDKSAFEVQTSFLNQEIGILRGAHIGNVSDLEEALTRAIPFFTEENFSYSIDAPKQYVKHFVAKALYSNHINDQNFIKFQYNIQKNNRQEYDVRRAGRSDIPIVNLDLVSQMGSAIWEHTGPSGQNTVLGVQAKYQNNSNLAGTGSYPLIPDYLSFVPAIFGQYKIDNGKFNFETGARYEQYYYKVYKILSGQIDKINRQFHAGAINMGLNFQTKKTSIKGDISFIARAPMINELYNSGLHQGIAALEYGDPNLTVEKSLKSTIDFTYNLGKAGNFFATVFAQSVKDFIYFVPEATPQLTVRGAFLVYRYKNTDAFIRGFDVMHVLNLQENLEWSSKLSYIRSANTKLREEIVLTPPLRLESSINHALSLSKKHQQTLETGLAFQYNGKQNHVNPLSDFTAVPEAYSLWNAIIGLHTTIHKRSIKFEVQVSNLFNKNYRDYLNRMRYFANDLGRNFVFTINYKI